MIVPGRSARRRQFVCLCGAVVFLLALGSARPSSGQQPPAVTPSAEVSAPLEALRDYVIGPQDLLQITILESPELSREVRVGPDGAISLPLLERVSLNGLTLVDAETLLERMYRDAGVLNDPHISISVKDLQSKPVTVMGAVRSPGVFQVSGQSRLLRVLSQAGGITSEAGGTVQVIRAEAMKQEQVVSIRVEDVVRGALEANLPVYGGDTVNVIPAGAVYVVGAVNSPGRHLLLGEGDDAGILQVLALAHDMTKTAKPDKAVLIRKNASGELDQIPVNLKKILGKQVADVRVQPNDVLYVPDSVSKRAFARGLQAALQVATAVAVAGVI